jgi:tetratricopeptide (TPR) repeat protein
MSGFPDLGSFEPSKKVLREVARIRRAIAGGSLDQRENLIETLGELAASYVAEGCFDDALKMLDEIFELTETLLDEGKIEIPTTMFQAVAPVFNFVDIYKHKYSNKKINEEAFFQRNKKCIEMLPEKEFLTIKNEWALSIHQRAESLHDNGAAIAAIALLDESLRMMESHFDQKTSQFTEWKPFLDIYRSRGQWKCALGDEEGGIADLLHYETIANQADAIVPRGGDKKKMKSTVTKNPDGNMVLSLDSMEMLDFFAAFHFQKDRYEAILFLGNTYAGRAEKEKALEYFDKARAIADENENERERGFMFFVALADIPYRKGFLFAQYHEFDKALEQYDLAVEGMRELLLSKKDESYVPKLESLFADISRARAEVLQNLGRFDEAKQALELTCQLFIQTLKTEKIAENNDEENKAMEPLSIKHLLTDKRQGKIKPPGKMLGKGEEFDEKKMLKQIGVLHNEATMNIGQASIATQEGLYRKAIRYLLKARFIIDSPVLIMLKEAKQNVFSIYNGIARIRLVLKEYDESLKWFERTIRYIYSLKDDGKIDYRSLLCTAMEGLGQLYSETRSPEKALEQYKKVFALRTQLIEEQEGLLEGRDREQIRIRENQRLMPLAVLYKAQIDTIRAIETQVFVMNKPETMVRWINLEWEMFENYRKLLLRPEMADEEDRLTTGSCAALLRWVGEEEQSQEHLKRWVDKYRDDYDTEEKKDVALAHANAALTFRLKELYAMTDFRDGSKLCERIAVLAVQNRFHETYTVSKVFRSLLVHELSQHQNLPLVKQEFYESLIRLVDRQIDAIKDHIDISEPEGAYKDYPYDPDEVRAILDQIEKEEKESLQKDEPDEDEYDASLYEQDYETAADNNAMLYKMLDAFTGNEVADDLIEQINRQKNSGTKVGRNDPCPCGSGRKYKKCCGGK